MFWDISPDDKIYHKKVRWDHKTYIFFCIIIVIYYNSTINYRVRICDNLISLFVAEKYLTFVSNWSNYLPVKIRRNIHWMRLMLRQFFSSLKFQFSVVTATRTVFTLYFVCLFHFKYNSRWIIISRFFLECPSVSCVFDMKIAGLPNDYAILIVSHCNLNSIF